MGTDAHVTRSVGNTLDEPDEAAALVGRAVLVL